MREQLVGAWHGACKKKNCRCLPGLGSDSDRQSGIPAIRDTEDISMLRVTTTSRTIRHQPPSSILAQGQGAIRSVPLPRMRTRVRHTDAALEREDRLHQFRVQWARDRQNAMQVNLDRLNDSPRSTETRLAAPWRTVEVPRERLDLLRRSEYSYCSAMVGMWCIGAGREVANCNPVDINPGALDRERLTRRPGQGRFDQVVPGAYGNRNFKYLFAIDHLGMHIAREMTPCNLDSRGIITHSKLVDRGVIGGEIFFDIDDPGKVYINFGSARLPIQNTEQAYATAEFVVSLGYETVVAMIPDRDLSQQPYGMADRYGEGVQNVVFRAPAVASVQPEL